MSKQLELDAKVMVYLGELGLDLPLDANDVYNLLLMKDEDIERAEESAASSHSRVCATEFALQQFGFERCHAPVCCHNTGGRRPTQGHSHGWKPKESK